MDYAKPTFSVQKVNAAGRFILIYDEESPKKDVYTAFQAIDNWRAAHHFPLSSIYVTLKNRARSISHKAITAQRIKRFISIAMKLLDRRDMKLSQMQDIAGCRAVMSTLADVYRLRDLYSARPLTHRFIGQKDYIAEPRSTGYRGIHLKYRFTGKGNSLPWDGLKVEIQLRTQLQHKWATAVEAAETFTGGALKSNRGRAEWLRFFALMGSVFALREQCPTVPQTPTTFDELCSEIRELNRVHHIVPAFSQYRALIPHFERRSGAKYYLVTLDPLEEEVKVVGFKGDQSQQANRAYAYEEDKLRRNSDTRTQVVLVSVSSVSALKRAYPNYFLDTQDFLGEVLQIVG